MCHLRRQRAWLTRDLKGQIVMNYRNPTLSSACCTERVMYINRNLSQKNLTAD